VTCRSRVLEGNVHHHVPAMILDQKGGRGEEGRRGERGNFSQIDVWEFVKHGDKLSP